MVNQKVLVRDKHKRKKRMFKFLLVIIGIIIILAISFFTGFFSKNPTQEIILENPLKNIVFENTNEAGEVNQEAVIQQGISKFDENYIIYLLAALGVNSLHKSPVGYGSAKINLILDDETWSAKKDKELTVKKQTIPEPDLNIRMSKQDAVIALLSPNIQEFLKSSVRNGNTQIEQVAGKIELGSKGYLKMYKDLTGEDIEADE